MDVGREENQIDDAARDIVGHRFWGWLQRLGAPVRAAPATQIIRAPALAPVVHCQAARAGRPKRISRILLASDRAMATSLPSPSTWPTPTSPASWTPSPAGATKTR